MIPSALDRQRNRLVLPFAFRRTRLLLPFALMFLLACPLASPAEDWLAGEDATGTWGGLRSELDDKGLHVDLDYTAETFTRDASDAAYRGNLDLQVILDTAKAHLWKGGTVLAYGQSDHGGGVSEDPGFAMPVSNYEGPSFTQLSEFWLYQELPGGLALRLGKQDANRDFAAPRFGGNFMNASFGVLPTSPMPSYPAPALGTAAFVQATDWLDLRGGVYEGDPKVESFGKHAFDGSAGVFGIGAANVRIGKDGPRDTLLQVGGWHHSGQDRSGAFGVADVIVRMAARAEHDYRTLQFFVRGNWEPDANAPDARFYVGGGATAHGFVGANNTFGLGGGFVSIANADQGFVELFFKWRPMRWFTVEPDAQLYFLDGDTNVIVGLRCKLKL